MKYGFIKVGAFTPKIKVADVEFNVQSIINGINVATESGVELLVFPEMSITGYTCADLFYSNTLLSSALVGLNNIAKATKNKNVLVFVGLPVKKGNGIYNAVAGICKGEILAVIPKRLLCNSYDCYESRWFSVPEKENSEIIINNKSVPFGTKIIFKEISLAEFTVGVEIGQEAFNIFSPAVMHVSNGANVIVNPACLGYTVGKEEGVKVQISAQSSRLVCGYVRAEAGEGESTTDGVYAGQNYVYENGNLLAYSNAFTTGLTCIEIDTERLVNDRLKTQTASTDKDVGYKFIEFSALTDGETLTRKFDINPFMPNGVDVAVRAEKILEIQAQGLKKRIEHTNAGALVLGLSGGLDSTLAILVAVRAMERLNRSKKDIIAVTMPCFGTTSRTYLNTIQLAKSLGVTLKKVDITKSVTRHLKDIKHPNGVLDVTFENAQARERTQVLMDIANMYNGMVVGTGDMSELALGWATYNGDHMSMYGVNCSVPKTLVRHIVECFAQNSKGKLKAVLFDVLDTPVSPELLPATNDKISQKTEDIVGPYTLHDFYLYHFIRSGYSPKKILYIANLTFKGLYTEKTIAKWLKTFVRRFFNQQFKRSCVPDGVKVGSVALSPRGDLKMPSDAVSKVWLDNLEEI